MPEARRRRARARVPRVGEARRARYTFLLSSELVERARSEVAEGEVIRSIEAALAAAIDYQSWLREVRRGERGVLS